MIYVSSSSIRKDTMKEVIEGLYLNGFSSIELSGGTNYYKDLEDDLIRLKREYDLNYLCHHYFPPPLEHFVLNLASLNDVIFEKSLECLIKAIRLSKRLGASKFSFHAGFLMDVNVDEIGNKFSLNRLYDRDKAMERFCMGFNVLEKEAMELQLYIENNVFSYSNSETYRGINPFMLTNYNEYLELKKNIELKLLLDVGHLQVSSKSLNLDFYDELEKLIMISDYIHLSENDGLHDQHRCLSNSSAFFNILRNYSLKDKTVTIEVCEDIQKVRMSYDLINEIIQSS